MQTRQTLPALTGVRFIAAFAVVAYHFAKPTHSLLRTVNSHGFIGVTLFFVLSGFILTYTYSLGAEQPKREQEGHFGLLVSQESFPCILSAWLSRPHLFWRGAQLLFILPGFASLILVQAWLPGYMEWNPPGWSLSAEAFFYLIFPFAVVPISQLRRNNLLSFIGICYALSLLAPLTYAVSGAIDGTFWIFNPAVRLPEFLIGIAVGALWLQPNSIAARLPKYTAELSLVALSLVICLPINEAYFMNGACAPLIVTTILGLAQGRDPAASLLGSRYLVLLGSASYILYILHWPL